MIKLTKNQEKVILVGIIIIICISIGYKLIFNSRDNIKVVKSQEVKSEESTQESENQICVYITGEVTNPGIYYLKNGARVDDLVKKAGGFTNNADKNSVNLAEKLRDEQQLSVQKKLVPGDTAAQIVQVNPIINGKININAASAEDIDEFLPGIGETLANNIVNYRNKNGKFKSVNDITKVDGIGSGKRFEKIKDLIMVN